MDEPTDVAIEDQPIFAPSEPAVQATETAPAQETGTETPPAETKEAETTSATEETKEASAATEVEPTQGEQKTEPQSADDRRREAAHQGWQRRQQEKEAEQRFDSRWSPKDATDLADENGIDPQAAEVQALKAQLEFNQYRSQVVQLNADMASDAIEVENDFAIFNPKSDSYDKEFAESVMEDYRKDAHLEVDDQGNILRADRPLYDYIQRRYDSYTRGLSKGSVIGQQTHQEMLARTENPGGSSSQGSADLSKLSAKELLERIGDQPLF